jgi:hypothetical protein
MDAYQEYVTRKREREAATAAPSRAASGQVEPGPRPEPERRVNGWAVFWAVALAAWLAVTVVFIAADTSDPESGDVLAPILVGWTFLWLFCVVALAFIGLELTDPAPSVPNQNQLLATQNGLIAEQNRLLAGRCAEARPAPAPHHEPRPPEGHGLHGYLSSLNRPA